MAERVITEAGKTFSEFSLLTNFTPKECTLQKINLSNKLNGMELRLPFMSAAMTSVTGYEMALSLGKEGGIGILPARLSIKEQVEIIEKIKGYENHLADQGKVTQSNLNNFESKVNDDIAQETAKDFNNQIKNKYISNFINIYCTHCFC